MESHRARGLNDRQSFLSYGGWESRTKVLVHWGPCGDHLSGSWMAVFSLCPHMTEGVMTKAVPHLLISSY